MDTTTAPTGSSSRTIVPLPRYRSHKIIEAALIVSIAPPSMLVLDTGGSDTIAQHVEPGYFEKHGPKVGGYYVRYEGGYESWSPADVFLKGNRPVAGTVEEIARICHEVNRAYCEALGDHSQPPWNAAEEWQKESARVGVKLHLEHPDAGAKASHDSWMAQKVADGWVRGDVKDPAAKTHPCMVPFHELPVAQQAKDYIFRGVVHALADL